MTFRRWAARALDRRGGRAILAYLATRTAQEASPGAKLEFVQDMWTHRVGGFTFVDSADFEYFGNPFLDWPRQVETIYSGAEDNWFSLYKPRDGDTIVDIGSGKGEDAIAFSHAAGPRGRVLAIEAHPVTYRCLELFCRLNRLANITPLHCAVVGKPGQVSINTMDNYLSNSVVTDIHGATTVPGFPLDELIHRQGIARIDLLKMNIEGAEAAAIGGMTHSFSITRALVISCHDFRAERQEGEFFRTKALIQEAVRRHGFRVVSRDSDPRAWIADQVNAIRD